MLIDWDTAIAIQGAIATIARQGSVRIGIVRHSLVPWAISDLRAAGFKKPFFAKPAIWLRQVVLEVPETFAVLRVNTELEVMVNGAPVVYRATGYRLGGPNDAPLEYYHGDRPIDTVLAFDLTHHSDLITQFLKD